MAAEVTRSTKPVRFEERRSVVAVYEVPQADEPPGRGTTREVEVLIAHRYVNLGDGHVAGAVRRVNEVGR